MTVLKFDKLYAVSDLHLGGPQGRQAFRESEALCWLITQAQAEERRVALLLNGDIVDFLAYGREAKEFNLAPEGFLRRIAVDLAFGSIFSALRDFVANPQHILVLQVGNHDIELALPSANVKKVLIEHQQASDSGVQERVLVESSGAGWTCRVGDQIVLALHGNASDPWNEVDYSGLGNAARALEAGQLPKSLPATNAGTMLVIHVMNAIKEDYPFVDLLKPEGAPLMAVLNAVNARQSTRGLLKALRIRATKGNLRELLAAEEDRPGAPVESPEGQMLSFLSAVELPPTRPRDTLRRAERNFSKGITPRSLVSEEDEKLGALYDFGRVHLERLAARYDRLLGTPDKTSLRRALRAWLAEDESFDIHVLSSIDQRIARCASRGVDVLLAGHTHFPREVQLGPMTYLNTGTWMRVLKLKDSKYLEDDAEFTRFMAAALKGTLDELDKLEDIDPRDRPVAIVDADGARLYSVQGSPGKFERKPMLEVSS